MRRWEQSQRQTSITKCISTMDLSPKAEYILIYSKQPLQRRLIQQRLGYWCNNTNQKLLVNSNWHLDIETANGLWGSNWTVGTTTKSGDNSLTSTSTATLMPSTAIAASATGFYDRDTRTVLGTYYDGGGNATTTPFLLDKNVCLVVYSDHSEATSSDSYLSSGGFTTFVGGFHADVEIR